MTDEVTIPEILIKREAETLGTELLLLSASELILYACNDLEKVMADPAVRVVPGDWHRISFKSDTKVCYLCLAGAVLHQGLPHAMDVVCITASDMPQPMRQVMSALNCIRSGHCHQGVRSLQGNNWSESQATYLLKELEFEFSGMMPAITDTARFLQMQRAMAAELKRIGF